MAQEITKDILTKAYIPRQKDARKYDSGLLTVIGGSEFYSGAPSLTALAAFRSGVDMARVIAPKRAADIVAGFTPILAAYPLKGEFLTKEHLPTLLAMTESARLASRDKAAVVIGSGLGRTEETLDMVLEYLSQVSVPVVIDADAIYALSKNMEVLAGKPFLVTPHSYEFFILTGQEIQGLSLENKAKIVMQEAGRLKTTILLKGSVDIISDGKDIFFNNSGNPLMSKGGTGDTLAGISGALLARGAIAPILAAQAAAFINGLAGELAIKKYGESFVTTDLIDEIPNVLN